MSNLTVGWQEWCAFPALGLPAIKAKIDTGATTSALHAFDTVLIEKEGIPHVQFSVHPIQKRNDVIRVCSAPLIDRRVIVDSGGHKELRYVVRTAVMMGKETWDIDVTLTDRETMKFRMLLGRRAMMDKVTIDPGLAFLLGRKSASQLRGLYSLSL